MSNKKDKPFVCNYCPKSFGLFNQLIIHRRKHTGEKPFLCRFCPKDFASMKVLRVHERIHTGERPYKCQFCNKAFSAYANLVVHRRIHTNEKPYKCRLCRRAFEHSGNLNRHIRAHLIRGYFRCILCSQMFTKDEDLLIHTKINHKLEYNRYTTKPAVSSNKNNKSDRPNEPNIRQQVFLPNENDQFMNESKSSEGVCLKTNVPEGPFIPNVGLFIGSMSSFDNNQEISNERTAGLRALNNSENVAADTCNSGPDAKSTSKINVCSSVMESSDEFASKNPQWKDTNQYKQEDISFRLNINQDKLSHSDDPPPLIPIEHMENVEISSTEGCLFDITQDHQKASNELLINRKKSTEGTDKLSTNDSFTFVNGQNWNFDASHQMQFIQREIIQKGNMTNFLITEIQSFLFRKKIEKILFLMFGNKKLEQFGYPQKGCEQVMVSILDSMDLMPCADVRIDEKERYKINLKLLIESSFPSQLSFDILDWKEKTMEEVLDRIIAKLRATHI